MQNYPAFGSVQYLFFTAVASAGTNACHVYFFKPDSDERYIYTFQRGIKNYNEVRLATSGNHPYSHAQSHKAILSHLVETCEGLTYDAARHQVCTIAKEIAHDYLINDGSQSSLRALVRTRENKLEIRRINAAPHYVKISTTPFYDSARPSGDLIEIPFHFTLEDDNLFTDSLAGIIHDFYLKTFWSYDAQEDTLKLVESIFSLGEWQLLGFGLNRTYLVTQALASLFIPSLSSEYKAFGVALENFVKLDYSFNSGSSRNLIVKLLLSSQYTAELANFIDQRQAIYR